MTHESISSDPTERFIEKRTAEFDPEQVPELTAEKFADLTQQLNDMYEAGLQDSEIQSRFAHVLHESGIITGNGDLEEKVVRMVDEDGTSELRMIVTSFHDFGTVKRGVELIERRDEANDENAEKTERLRAEVQELLGDARLAMAVEAASDVVRQNAQLLSILAEGESILNAARYNDGRVASPQLLEDMLSRLRQTHASAMQSGETLSQSARGIVHAAEDVSSHGRFEGMDDTDLYRLRKIEEGVQELEYSARGVDMSYEEIGTILTRYGQFESNLEELARTSRGYEYTIASLTKRINDMTDAVYHAQSRALNVEDAVRGIKKAQPDNE